MAEGTPDKGRFGPARLPVSPGYVRPATRSRALIVGAGAGLLGLIVLAMNFWLQSGHLVSSGQLSASHATLETNCASCHVPFRSVPAGKCSACHERLPAHLGSYSFSAHYVYVSADHTRAFTHEGEVPCATCHLEHRGRDVEPTAVSDDRCVQCHPYAPFAVKHPQFSFVARPVSDSEALKFTHIKHVERVLDATKSGDVEGSCLVCHEPAADGFGFQPIRFGRGCASCHLGPNVSSADLEIVPSTGLVRRAGGRADVRLGVETLEMIRRQKAPGEQWALSTSPTQFEERGGVVTKTGIDHKDPWITHNLRTLRHVLYPTQDLADLLVASPDVDTRDRRVLYEEALQTIQTYALGLRGQSQPWVQEELLAISQAIAQLETRIADPSAPLSATKFRIDRTLDPALTVDQVREVNEFAATVAAPCLMCHRLRDVTIVRPAADQRVLRRAVFNHRAHVIQRGCLECHTAIPFSEYLDTRRKVPPAVDRAAIQNIPKVEVCRGCHTGSKASTECRTCHVFHPTSDARANLDRAAR